MPRPRRNTKASAQPAPKPKPIKAVEPPVKAKTERVAGTIELGAGRVLEAGTDTRICPFTGLATKPRRTFAGLGTDARVKSLMNKIVRDQEYESDLAEAADPDRILQAALKAKDEGWTEIDKPSNFF